MCFPSRQMCCSLAGPITKYLIYLSHGNAWLNFHHTEVWCVLKGHNSEKNKFFLRVFHAQCPKMVQWRFHRNIPTHFLKTTRVSKELQCRQTLNMGPMLGPVCLRALTSDDQSQDTLDEAHSDAQQLVLDRLKKKARRARRPLKIGGYHDGNTFSGSRIPKVGHGSWPWCSNMFFLFAWVDFQVLIVMEHNQSNRSLERFNVMLFFLSTICMQILFLTLLKSSRFRMQVLWQQVQIIRIIGDQCAGEHFLQRTSDQSSTDHWTTWALKNHRDAIPLNLLHDILL